MRLFRHAHLPLLPPGRHPGRQNAGAGAPGGKEERARRARSVAEELRRRYLEEQVGRTLSVLFEEEKDGLWRGHASNYTEVAVSGQGLHNVERPVRITGVSGERLTGEPV